MGALGTLVMTNENPYHQLQGCMNEYKERFDNLSERDGVVPLVAYQVLPGLLRHQPLTIREDVRLVWLHGDHTEATIRDIVDVAESHMPTATKG